MSDNRSSPAEWLEQVDLICDRFEAQWKRGDEPSIEIFLIGVPAAIQHQLVRELLKIDVRYRRQKGEQPGLAQYLSRLPRFGEVVKASIVSAAQPASEPMATAAASQLRFAAQNTATPPVGPRVVLRIATGPHKGEQFAFESHQTLVVGRGADAQWRLLKDPYFSRYQFRVETNPPECRVIDLESTNGTHVNGSRIEAKDLAHGDRIECGDTVFEIEITQPADPGEAATLEYSRRAPPDQPRSAGVEPFAEDSQPLPTVAPSDEEPPPKKLADFELVRELGRGAMGVVYQAVQRSTGRDAAVKLICPATRSSPEAVQLFLREASILSQLQHPRIVEYLSLGLHEGRMYLAMEYLPTVDFGEVLRSQSREKQIRLACGIMARVLEALQHAHERDVVHRDVKPSNILVYRAGGRVHVKLADFGLAKNYLNAGFSSISRENNVRGTLAYMAPEQLINCRFAKPACDIYAAGACLYVFLAGTLPHDATSGRSALARMLNSPFVPLAERAPDLSLELTRLVERALAREPGERHSSAEHMRKALLKFA